MLFNSSRKRIIIIILSLVLAEFNLEQCSSAECGIAENNDDARLSYLVLIFGIKEQIIYKSCIGTVIKLTFNDTFSDLILTSRTCLEKEDLHSSRVSEMLHISWYGPTHEIVKVIEPISMSEKSDRIPNFAIVKLRTMISLQDDDGNIPICLPEGKFPYSADMECYMPHISSGIHFTFQPFFKIIILPPNKWPTHPAHFPVSRRSQLCGTCTVSASNNTTIDLEKLKVVTEGAPLLCRINNTDYQYGIYDWTKLHRVSKNTSQPIAIFTELYPFNLIFNFFASNMTYITGDSIIL
ncbi:Serine protease [Trichinella spiralis]|uniref:Serine protease n=1 Tax=Trichinella spiralis TaxID=6334 RepID=A0ABR3K4I4_TRISP